MLRLASWNVNSLGVRLDQVCEWLVRSETDVLALQETKLPDERFPSGAFEALGYSVVFSGQKSWNGMAIISRLKAGEVLTDIEGFEDPARRILAVNIGSLRVVNLYVPNGAAPGTDKYAYKLEWLKHVTAFLALEAQKYPYLAVVGDFNIAPEDCDVHDPAGWEGSVLVSPPEREAFAALLKTGLVDSFRHFPQPPETYSWWDYRAAAFRRNNGLRIDHILLSPALMALCRESTIDREARRHERPSDHAPVSVVLDIPILD